MSLANILSNAVNSVSSILSGGAASLYPEEGLSHAVTTVQSSNWKLDLGYEFDVENSGGKFKPFPLQINPTALEQRETPTSVIIPVQTGVVVEHQGFVVKDLIVSGTTGIQPGRGAGGVTGQVNFGLGTDLIPSGIPLFSGKQSGYMEIMLLRNYFRAYQEVKKQSGGSAVRLVFRNRKDNEHWYVEPIGPGIIVSRNASRPFLYDYAINLKIVGKANERAKTYSGPLSNFFTGLQKVENFIDDVAESIDFFANAVNATTDLLETIEKNLSITILAPIEKISKAIAAIKNGKTRVSVLPKKFYRDTRTSILKLRDNYVDFIGKGNTNYNTVKGRIALEQKRSFIIDDVSMLNAFVKVDRAINKVVSTDSLFTSQSGDFSFHSTSTDVDSAISINEQSTVENRIGSLSSLNKQFGGNYTFKIPTSAIQVKLEFKETIERFAARTLGDATRANEIILLNNLDPPYISETAIASKHTVASGDFLLVPSEDEPITSGVLDKQDSARIVRDLTSVEKQFGVDIMLDDNGDIAINSQIPDIKLIAGFDNAAQALKIAVGIEKGSLLWHPNKGISSQIGKSGIITAGDIADEISTTILSDNRFLAVNQLSVTRDQLNIAISAVVRVRNVNQPIPLKFTVT